MLHLKRLKEKKIQKSINGKLSVRKNLQDCRSKYR